ncbi:MAG: ATP-binding protein [Parvibaculum sp.]|nr:ATP-binding protein [Parvibaculum sp.]
MSLTYLTFEPDNLTSLYPGLAPMPPVLTIISFGLGSLVIGLLSFSETQKPYQLLTLRAAAAIILAINLMAIAGQIVDGTLLASGPKEEQIALATAVNFIFFALAAFIGKTPHTGHASAILLLCGLTTTSLALVGYAFDAEAVRRVTLFAPWSLPTAICFALLFCAALFSRPQLGWTARIVGRDSGSAAARQFLPLVLILPVVLSGTVLSLVEHGIIPVSFGFAAGAIIAAVVLGIITYLVSRLLGIREAGLLDEVVRRTQAESSLLEQLERLNLLNGITQAISERQDISSIYQVVLRKLEDNLPLDLAFIAQFDIASNSITICNVSRNSVALARTAGLSEHTQIEIEGNGLSKCVQGRLIYEPKIAALNFPFPQRLAHSGLGSLVMAPMTSGDEVFGIIVTGRIKPEAFSEADCEFLSQLSEHVAVATHQAQLLNNLQRAYDDMRDTQKSVMQHERLRALGQMASGIAHDVNNAISPISIQTQSIMEFEKNLSAPVMTYLTMVNRQINDVAATIGRLREFYRERETTTDLAPVDLNALAKEVIELSEARWKDIARRDGITITVQTELASTPPIIMGKDNELREVMVNLIFNAVDAMTDGGTITIRTKVTEDGPTPDGLNHYRFATLEISDTGIGMDENTVLRCMEPFYTTKGERGTGLGLAMVHGILKRHDATIDIKSKQGEGATFYLKFPLPLAATIPERKTETQQKPDAMRLLMIDDDPYVLEALVAMLEMDKHIVTGIIDARDGLNAFKTALEEGQPFDVVITDLGMPYLDGNQVTHAIKEMSASTPVILLTGWGQRQGGDRNNENEADFVLGKPPQLRKLRDTLIRCKQSA